MRETWARCRGDDGDESGYLAMYERCEERLQPDIMNGDLRPFASEKGRLEHIASTPEAVTLPEACQQQLDELRPRCEDGSPVAAAAPYGGAPPAR